MAGRFEFNWLNKLITNDAAHFDIGPIEGFELVSLLKGISPEKVLSRGLRAVQPDQKLPSSEKRKGKSERHITAMNLWGKTPVEGIAYQPYNDPFATGIEDNTFDSISLIHVLGYIGTGIFNFGHGTRTQLSQELARILVPDGRLYVACAIGLAELARTRLGSMHVFHMDEVPGYFQTDFHLKSVQTFRGSKKIDWKKIAGNPGIQKKHVVQTGFYVFGSGKGEGMPLEDADLDPKNLEPKKKKKKKKGGLFPSTKIVLET